MNAHEFPVTIRQLAAVPLLVLLNGFFVAAEFALVKMRDTQLETLVSKGHRRAKVARRIVRNLDAALSSTQLIWLLNHAAFWLLRRCGLQPVNESELVHSEEEIRLILGESRRHANGPTLGQDIERIIASAQVGRVGRRTNRGDFRDLHRVRFDHSALS